MLIPCACSHGPVAHEHYHAGGYCGRCKCPFYRPARMRWWQVWRPRMSVPDSPAALTAIPTRRAS